MRSLLVYIALAATAACGSATPSETATSAVTAEAGDDLEFRERQQAAKCFGWNVAEGFSLDYRNAPVRPGLLRFENARQVTLVNDTCRMNKPGTYIVDGFALESLTYFELPGGVGYMAKTVEGPSYIAVVAKTMTLSG
jgi:hypothetical protein